MSNITSIYYSAEIGNQYISFWDSLVGVQMNQNDQMYFITGVDY